MTKKKTPGNSPRAASRSSGVPPKVEKYQVAVKAEPDSPVAHMKLGTAWLKAGDGAQAEVALRRAVELDPGYAEAWVNLGGVMLGRWEFEDCVEANGQALKSRPDLLEAHYNKGLGHLYLGQAEEMVECFRRVVELNPDHPGGNYHLAVGLLALKQVAEARMSLAKATELGYSPQPEFLKALEREGGGGVTTIELGPGGSDSSNSRDDQKTDD